MIEPSIRTRSLAAVNSRTLRQFAALWLLVLGGLALWHGLFKDRPILGLSLGALAVIFGVAGLAKPASVRWLFVGLTRVTHPIGCVVSYVVLSVLFYLMVWPLGALFRLLGRDPLALRAGRPAASYLTKKPAANDLDCYLRQS